MFNLEQAIATWGSGTVCWKQIFPGSLVYLVNKTSGGF